MEEYFNSKNFKLYNKNSLDFISELPENSVDMIFADPPYFLSNGSFSCQNGKRVSVKKGNWDIGSSIDDNFKFHYTWLKNSRRVLKDNGTLWVSGTYHSIYQCGYALQKLGYHILNDISWLKPNAAPNLSCRFFTASHETLIWVRKSKKSKHTFNYNELKNGNWKNDFIKKPNKQMRSVWAISTPKLSEKKFGKHPTQKPEELLKRIIISSTNRNDIILDPFCGSSTTGIVAFLLNRRYIGVDTSKEYLDLSIKRYKEIIN